MKDKFYILLNLNLSIKCIDLHAIFTKKLKKIKITYFSYENAALRHQH